MTTYYDARTADPTEPPTDPAQITTLLELTDAQRALLVLARDVWALPPGSPAIREAFARFQGARHLEAIWRDDLVARVAAHAIGAAPP